MKIVSALCALVCCSAALASSPEMTVRIAIDGVAKPVFTVSGVETSSGSGLWEFVQSKTYGDYEFDVDYTLDDSDNDVWGDAVFTNNDTVDVDVEIQVEVDAKASVNCSLERADCAAVISLNVGSGGGFMTDIDSSTDIFIVEPQGYRVFDFTEFHAPFNLGSGTGGPLNLTTSYTHNGNSEWTCCGTNATVDGWTFKFNYVSPADSNITTSANAIMSTLFGSCP